LAGAAVGGITPVRPARVDSVLFPWDQGRIFDMFLGNLSSLGQGQGGH